MKRMICFILLCAMLVSLTSCKVNDNQPANAPTDSELAFWQDAIYDESPEALNVKLLEQERDAMQSEEKLASILDANKLSFDNYHFHVAKHIRWYDGYGVWNGTESIELFAHDGETYCGDWRGGTPYFGADPTLHIRVLYHPNGYSTKSLGIANSHKLLDGYTDVYWDEGEMAISYYFFIDEQFAANFIFTNTDKLDQAVIDQMMEYRKALQG